MMGVFAQGGVIMWPLLLIALVIVALDVWAFARTRGMDAPDPVLETGIDATLFWGAWAGVVGLLGTFVGIYQAAGFIEQAGAINAGLIWGGIKVALTTTIFGLLIFTLAGITWFILRTMYRRRAAA